MNSSPASPLAQDFVALEKFRTSISGLGLGDYALSDGYLLRWLRAKDFNVGKAKELLETHLEFDRRHDMANILSWEPPAWFHSEYFYEITGVTPEGNPVLLAPFGVWDLLKATKTGQAENWLRYCDQIWTKLENRLEETGASQAIAIYDYAGHSIRQAMSMATLQLFMEFARRCEANHPGLFKDTFIINASKVFQLMFKFAQPVIEKETMASIQIFGHDKAEWFPAVLKKVPVSLLPVEYGGTIVREKPAHVPDDSIVVNVKHGEKFCTELQVDEPGTLLKWRFWTKSHDIGFEILRDGVVKIRGYERVSHGGQEKWGQVHCEAAGKYSFIFDNTHSKFRGKVLHYSINMLTPEVLRMDNVDLN